MFSNANLFSCNNIASSNTANSIIPAHNCSRPITGLIDNEVLLPPNMTIISRSESNETMSRLSVSGRPQFLTPRYKRCIVSNIKKTGGQRWMILLMMLVLTQERMSASLPCIKLCTAWIFFCCKPVSKSFLTKTHIVKRQA
ncbi:hypothetical protein PHYBLDRAFT_72065 [Phycomyces blakesleeanus NRRL 1555(-)]|uniref:Homeodomain-like DNA binding domain-containing transcription factor n=1 Tax=Phycomyces blakesleeanus (strain ATCC 8743b / DSM 1359 / FGSC 10004 / NBRC 33097 / NRRL 1555) TaxID=763407 RepID=A0A162U135_PHYB8|nr:hypothetical protein PHYBLDRAFT_72065 [Phycomyces blakesleeanus NRRL 1555(-)]OAD71473.1 hypothetical protein PHYBLDRAFT_72065 [Phycomyces blakesleeanus NRRL 1555(-)]|eukprot:XP_018289513.1 hypothetical protein PHYBLDRAFT_72065 [Phycomyces blakesleeanus NRRL 1555(-)]